MAGVTQSCPYCNAQMGMYVAFHSGLGPSMVTCDVTGQPIHTGRYEWQEMGVFRSAWYCLFSTVYAALIGLWGVFLIAALALAIYMPDPNERLGFQVLIGSAFAVFFAIGIGIQIARVRGSLHRTATGSVLTHRTARRYFYGQLAAVPMFIVVMILAMLVMWIRGPDL